jgi:hypothetical protein
MIQYSGNFIRIHFEANELTTEHTTIQLQDGYTYERLHINYTNNVKELVPYMSINTGDTITFPAVNSKSPSTIPIYVSDITKEAEIRITIEKFGQIPDIHYFDTNFSPILVTGSDGNEYNVIPSDQFK